MGSSRVERYLAHLDRLAPGREPRVSADRTAESRAERRYRYHLSGCPGRGLPHRNHLRPVVGRSSRLALGQAKTLISVRSSDDGGRAAVLADRLRGLSAFAYGETLNFGEQVSPDSSMSAFVIFAPAVLDRNDFSQHRHRRRLADQHPGSVSNPPGGASMDSDERHPSVLAARLGSLRRSAAIRHASLSATVAWVEEQHCRLDQSAGRLGPAQRAVSET